MDALLEQSVVKCRHHATLPVASTAAEPCVLQPLGCSNRPCAAAGRRSARLSTGVGHGRGNLRCCAQADGCRWKGTYCSCLHLTPGDRWNISSSAVAGSPRYCFHSDLVCTSPWKWCCSQLGVAQWACLYDTTAVTPPPTPLCTRASGKALFFSCHSPPVTCATQLQRRAVRWGTGWLGSGCRSPSTAGVRAVLPLRSHRGLSLPRWETSKNQAIARATTQQDTQDWAALPHVP